MILSSALAAAQVEAWMEDMLLQLAQSGSCWSPCGQSLCSVAVSDVRAGYTVKGYIL